MSIEGNSPKEAGEQLLRPIPISEPLARVGMDLLGALQTARRGHRFRNCGDRHLSKWIELRPLLTKDCEGVV